MKLYHATDNENKQSILENGLLPTDCGAAHFSGAETLQGGGFFGVYGFTSLSDAIWFGMDNGYETIVFEFEADEVIDDPEYDGEAKFFETKLPVAANLVYQK